VRHCRDRREISGPRLQHALADRRLRAMIDHDGKLWMALNQRPQPRQVARQH
jgi:hypothetical protein